MATATTSAIEQLLGAKAESLLGFKSPKISKERLHLPGPDFIDRVYAASDRNLRVLNNLHRMFFNGRLQTAPAIFQFCRCDQGIEHSGGASFAKESGLLRWREHRQAGDRRRLQRRCFDLRRAGLRGAQVRSQDPFIVKINHNELLTYPNRFDQVLFGTVEEAYDMGAAAVGATIYFGSEQSTRQIVEISQAFAKAHELGMATVLWCYLRNNAFKKDKDYHVSADLTGQANHLGVTIQAEHHSSRSCPKITVATRR